MNVLSTRHLFSRRLAPILSAFVLLIGAVAARAATWVVDSTSASAAVNACTAAANDCSFPGAVNRLAATGDSIVFTVASSLASEVSIAKDVIIDAAGASLPRLNISTSVGWATVTVRNAVWQNVNSGTTFGGAIRIAPLQIVTIEDSQFLYNRSTGRGGAIYNEGRLSITRTRFEGNYAPQGAGGIYSAVGATQFPGSLTVLDSVFRANGVWDPTGPARQLGQFGALQADSVVDIRSCLFYENESNYASAVQSGGLLRIYNSTFFANKTFQSTESGAFLLGGPVFIANSTIVSNTGATSGGLFVYPSSDTQIVNTLIADNLGASPDIAGRVYSHGNNLIRSRTGSNVQGNTAGTDVYNVAPQLGGLANNGGSTLTLALLPTSPARDAGSDCVLTASACNAPNLALISDQRGTGFARKRGSSVDIGAFESVIVTVTNSADNGAGSLRQAVLDALPNDTIAFATPFFSQARTITLGTTLVIAKPLSIVGPGVALLTLDGNNLTRHMNIDAGGNVKLSGVRFTRGNPGAGISAGAILINGGILEASDIQIDNSRSNEGGCLYNSGTLTLIRSVLTDCHANFAAAFFNETGKSAALNDVRIENSISSAAGGGIGNFGMFSMVRASISGNQATYGAGLLNYGTAVLTNVTLSGNSATTAGGGGAYLGLNSSNTLNHVTISANSSVLTGGGITAEGGAVINLRNTVIAGNTGGPGVADVVGVMTSQGYNVIGTAAGNSFSAGSVLTGVIVGTPARLAPLADNGGFARTHAPFFNSVLDDAGGNSSGVTVDARQMARPVDFSDLANASGGNGSDIGAYEIQVSTPVNIVASASASTSASTSASAGGVSVSFTGGANGGPAVSSYSVRCGTQTATGAASPIVVSGLAIGVPVTCAVTASSGALVGIPSGPSNSVTLAAGPDAPTSVIATRGNASVSVTFTPPLNDGGFAITSYIASCGTQSASAAAAPIIVSNLSNGSAVTCTVIATNAIGNSEPSLPSNSVIPATVPDAPTVTGISASDAAVTVSFNPPAFNGGSPVTFYNAFCGNFEPGGVAFVGAGSSSPITVSGLVNGVPTKCRVVAINAIGAGEASAWSANVVPGIAPAITSAALPNGIFGVAYSYTVTATGSPAATFSLSAGLLPPGLTLDASTGVVSGTPTSVSAPAANSGSITASNGVGTAAMQTFAIGIAAVVPNAPTGAIATRGNASVSVAFIAPTNTGGIAITGYSATCGTQNAIGAASPIVVSNLTNGTPVTCTVIASNAVGDSAPSAASNSVTPATVPNAPTSVIATRGNASVSVAFAAPVNTGGIAITGYSATCGSQTASGTASPIVVSNLTNGTAVTCTVIASNAVGDSAPSAASNSVTPATVPNAPTSVIATRGNASVSVAFAAPVNTGGIAITGYSATCGGQTASGTASPIVVSNLMNGTAVSCTVIAGNAVGDSAPSAASNSVTPATVPNAPSIGVATPGNSSASFQFTPPTSNGGAAILDYTVRCTPGNGQVTGTSSPLTLTGLSNGKLYGCSVAARNDVGVSAVSPSVNVIPAAVLSADLSITKSNGTHFVTGGAPTRYVIVVSNAGPAGVIGARVQDTLDPEFSNATWTCTGLNGGSCAASGVGNLDQPVDLPIAASVRFTLTAQVAALPETPVSNVASVTTPSPIDDPSLSNNVASDGPDVRAMFRDGFE